jgi:hypothetical protein
MCSGHSRCILDVAVWRWCLSKEKLSESEMEIFPYRERAHDLKNGTGKGVASIRMAKSSGAGVFAMS